MKKRVSLLFITALTAMLLGCAGMGGTLSIGLGSGASGKQQEGAHLGPFDYNSRVQLEATSYRGDIHIRANKVVLEGRGTGATKINGDVRISGNSCTLTNLTVSGNVYLTGNNNDLSGARVTGDVISEGNNNSW